MKKQLVLIKLGGSLITDKKRPLTARHRNIKFLSEEVEKVYNKFTDADFVIGSGGGSFAHFPAHEYGLREGARTKRQLYGMCLTHSGAQKLNSLVAENMLERNLPVFTLAPSAIVTNDDGKTVDVYTETLKNSLSKRIIPLVYGDPVYDRSRGTSILSTEKMLHLCAKNLRSMYDKITVIYLFDAEGVLNENGKVVQELNSSNNIAGGTLEHDVTGGITGKIDSAIKTAEYADRVYIASGEKAGVLESAISGKNTGTRITA